MRHIIYLITTLCCLALVSCGKQSAAVSPDEMASRAAKVYYDYLLHGDCAAYVDGFYRPDSIPERKAVCRADEDRPPRTRER